MHSRMDKSSVLNGLILKVAIVGQVPIKSTVVFQADLFETLPIRDDSAEFKRLSYSDLECYRHC